MHGLNKKTGREPFVHKSLPREGPLPTSNTQALVIMKCKEGKGGGKKSEPRPGPFEGETNRGSVIFECVSCVFAQEEQLGPQKRKLFFKNMGKPTTKELSCRSRTYSVGLVKYKAMLNSLSCSMCHADVFVCLFVEVESAFCACMYT